MPDPELNTLMLHDYVDRMRAGDRRAADELVRAVTNRLERLAARMLGGYPAARRLADTGDVLQGALLRLVQSLSAVRPESTRSFFNLAAVQMRRELLDLARKARARRLGDAPPPSTADESTGAGWEAAVPSAGDGDLDRWAALHAAVDGLPAVEREVFGLTFYHGWTQAQIAELLQVSERQVRRHWVDACRQLTQAVGGNLPGT
jgi:RNA polymerase sigma-70 factor (ECF subfamily)